MKHQIVHTLCYLMCHQETYLKVGVQNFYITSSLTIYIFVFSLENLLNEQDRGILTAFVESGQPKEAGSGHFGKMMLKGKNHTNCQGYNYPYVCKTLWGGAMLIKTVGTLFTVFVYHVDIVHGFV